MSSAKRALTPEDVLDFKNVEDAQISTDGSQVAFVIGDSFKADSKWPRSTIWLVATAGGEPRPLTSGPRTDSLPRWSPDASRLAFARVVPPISVIGLHLLPQTKSTTTKPTPNTRSKCKERETLLAFAVGDPWTVPV